MIRVEELQHMDQFFGDKMESLLSTILVMDGYGVGWEQATAMIVQITFDRRGRGINAQQIKNALMGFALEQT